VLLPMVNAMLHYMVLCLLLRSASASKAIINLDEYTFPRVVDGSQPVLVKFDRKYAVDAAYNKLALEISESNSDLVIAEVEVDEQSEMEIAQEKGHPTQGLSDELWNINLHNKYTAGRDLTLGPSLCLFPKGKDLQPLTFTGQSKDVMSWLRNTAKLEIGRKGTLQQMEDVLSTLRGGGNIDAALWQAKALSDINQERSRDVEYYIQVMEMIKQDGDQSLVKERNRVLRLVESESVAAKNRQALKPRLNVLTQFIDAYSSPMQSDEALLRGIASDL